VGLLHLTDHQLGDPVSAADLIRGLGIGVDKYDCDLTPVTRVDEARRVQTSDAVTGGETTSREDKAGTALRDLEGYPSGDRRPSAPWGENRSEACEQVTTSVPDARITGVRKVLVEAD
jgi:hypothetical protein